MLTKRAPVDGGYGIGILILVVGIAIGALVDIPSFGARADAASPHGAPPMGELSPILRPADEPEAVAENGLETLRFTIDREASETLQRVRDRGMARGIIVQTEEDTVPAVVEHGATRADADIRIKGDWTDHIATEKWSLRVKLQDERLFGMRVFSIQRAKARGFLWEWFVLEAFRREGVLAPRSTFVNVVINDNYAGVYFLEEHPAKELLESQGRREGAIVLWDEQARWDTLLQSHDVYSKDVRLPVPASAQPSLGMVPPFVRAYGEKRLESSEALTRSYYAAVEEMRALRNHVLLADDATARMKRLQALHELEGATIDSIVDVERVAIAHAVASLFQIQHALYWQNLRFYHDPVLDRLEPIAFDNMAQEASARDPVMFRRNRAMPPFEQSATYYNGVFRHLGRLCDPTWLEAFFADILPDAERFEAALLADDDIPAPFALAAMLQRVRTQQGYLRNVIFPTDPVSFAASYEVEEDASARVTGSMEVVAWGTTRTPVVVEGFRFSDGSLRSAASVLGAGDDALGAIRTEEGHVILPNDGRSVAFRFPVHDRLANLENVGHVIRAVKEQSRASRKLDLDVEVLFRPIAASAPTGERLAFQKRDDAWPSEGGRPPTPTLAEALARHPFLEYRAEEGRLVIRQGEWEVAGDLVVPDGVTLHAFGPVTLRFEQDACLVSSSPLVFEGNWETPIVLEPVAGSDRWSGVVVVRASGRSTWEHVRVRNTQAIARKGWVTTGGITFYRSPVTMRRCFIEGTLAEDGTNIFGADMLLERVTFSGCASDSFDGDFVSGQVVECTFKDGQADGVDFSGSDVDVIDCTFIDLMDKAISAGERSVVRVRGGLAQDVSIGIASKDGSRVHAEGMTIRRAKNYALAAFVKKSEYGPAILECVGLELDQARLGKAIVQDGSVVSLDGVAQPTQALDVGRLYADKVLGR